MSTYSKNILSGSTDGKGIKVVATATPGTLIHTGSSTSTTLQEVWLWAYNSSTSSVLLTIEFGDATAPDSNIKTTLAGQNGLILIVPGLILKGNSTPWTIKAFAATTNVITISGFINEIV
jgi:hypothetical protein